jgi:hypothetical protein
MLPTIHAAAHQAVQVYGGVRDIASLDPILDELATAAVEGRPFPLRFNKDGREFVIEDMAVEKGSFTVVLNSLRPATRPLPVVIVQPPATTRSVIVVPAPATNPIPNP